MDYYIPILLWGVAFVASAFIAYGVAAMVYRFCRRTRQSIANHLSPQKTYPAVVVGKREEVSRVYAAVGCSQAVETDYYITFEFRNGERREYFVDDNDYGLICEGDEGEVTVQGTWFCAFERTG